MAQIGVRKSIIKKRQTSYHAHEEKPTTKKTILGWIAVPAKYINKAVQKEKKEGNLRKLFGKVGEAGENFNKNYAASQKKTRKTAPKRKTTVRKTKTTRRKSTRR